MLHASPDVDVEVDLEQRRISVDLQEALSVHSESASFDLLKDKIMFPENDSLDADLDLEMANASATLIMQLLRDNLTLWTSDTPADKDDR
jgi:hypothetical protein